jgi:hypothetical protein
VPLRKEEERDAPHRADPERGSSMRRHRERHGWATSGEKGQATLLLPGASPDPCNNGDLTGHIEPRQPAQHRLSLTITGALLSHYPNTPSRRHCRPAGGRRDEIAAQIALHINSRGPIIFLFSNFPRDSGGNCPKRVLTRRMLRHISFTYQMRPCSRAVEDARRSWNSGRSDRLSSGRLDSDRILDQPGRGVSWPCSCWRPAR